MLVQLKMEISRANRFGHPLALLVLNLDRFSAWSQHAGPSVGADALDRFAAPNTVPPALCVGGVQTPLGPSPTTTALDEAPMTTLVPIATSTTIC